MEPLQTYPLTFSVNYPERALSRVSTFFRVVAAIPIVILFGIVTGSDWSFNMYSGSSGDSGASGSFATGGVGSVGFLVLPPLLMLLFRKKYPEWWANWNRELLRFINRVSVYLLLMDDRYPSTDEQQAVRLDFAAPDGEFLSRGLPLIKWLLAIPHYIVLFFLTILAVICVALAWLAILITARYPRGLFAFVEGVLRWHNRVVAYAVILVTDEYPPFSLKP